MSKGSAILVLGALLGFLPFTGFPTGFKIICSVIFGLAVMVLGFLVRQERLWLLRALTGEHKTNAYSENGASFTPDTSSQEA